VRADRTFTTPISAVRTVARRTGRSVMRRMEVLRVPSASEHASDQGPPRESVLSPFRVGWPRLRRGPYHPCAGPSRAIRACAARKPSGFRSLSSPRVFRPTRAARGQPD
jgi:hypothetical protein